MHDKLRNELLPYVTATITGLLATSPDDPIKQEIHSGRENRNKAFAERVWSIAMAVHQEGIDIPDPPPRL